MTANSSQIEAIKAALDTLGLALVHHGHVWTNQERGAYEAAIRVVDRLLSPQ